MRMSSSTGFLLPSLLLVLSTAGVLSQRTCIPGGACSVDPKTVVKEAKFAVTQLNKKADVLYRPLSFSSVIYATTQVVAGTNFFIQLKAKDSARRFRQFNVTLFRPLPKQGKEQPLQLKSYVSADPAPAPGGYSTVDPNAVSKQAAFAVSQLNQKSDVPKRPLKLISVIYAASQIVAGQNYFLQLKVQDSAKAYLQYDVVVYAPLPIGGNAQPYQLTSYKLAK